MKKIIYSIVTALVLSVILSVLIPEWLFKGDARWTYQNDAARVDVKFGGHVKDGRIDAEGADVQVLQPTWLSNEHYQGTCVLIPVSYQNKRCQIKLTPEAEVWGGDATLVIELKSRDFRHRGERRPAWVCFQNITLSGQPVAAEKVVWYNTPFVLKYPPHSAPEITLAFDVRKPLAASDIAFVNLLVVFSASLLLCLFFAPLKMAAFKVLDFIDGGNVIKGLSESLSESNTRIDPVYRRSFWIIFVVLCCAFGLHAIWFMWGNHDWGLVTNTRKWSAHAYEGRYMVYSVKALLSRGVYLPLIYDAITFVTLAFNAVLLCRYWRLEKRVIYYVLCGLVLTVQPFTLNMMYFVHMTPEVFIGVTCILIALLLSEKVATGGGGGYIILKIAHSFLSIVLINFALAMYPVLISTIAVAFAGRLLVQSFNWDGSREQLKFYIKPSMISVSNIVLGIALYKFVITFIFPINSMYNTDTLPLAQIPERLGVLLKQSIHQLYEYNYPFISQWILWVFLGFTLVLILYICSTRNFRQKIVSLFLLFGSLFATQTAMLIAKTHIVEGRVELFGLVFFEALVMVLVITQIKRLRRLSVIVGTCVIIASVLNDLDCLRVEKLSFDAEKMLWNRVLARMETQKDFDPTRKYDVVQVGRSIRMRPRYYTKLEGRDVVRDGRGLSYDAYDFSPFPLSAHQFFYPTNFRNKAFSSVRPKEADKSAYIARLRRLYQAGVLQKAEVWPKPNGLIVWRDIILFVTDGKELNSVKKRLERELGNK